jgi:hypothetical protein
MFGAYNLISEQLKRVLRIAWPLLESPAGKKHSGIRSNPANSRHNLDAL